MTEYVDPWPDGPDHWKNPTLQGVDFSHVRVGMYLEGKYIEHDNMNVAYLYRGLMAWRMWQVHYVGVYSQEMPLRKDTVKKSVVGATFTVPSEEAIVEFYRKKNPIVGAVKGTGKARKHRDELLVWLRASVNNLPASTGWFALPENRAFTPATEGVVRRTPVRNTTPTSAPNPTLQPNPNAPSVFSLDLPACTKCGATLTNPTRQAQHATWHNENEQLIERLNAKVSNLQVEVSVLREDIPKPLKRVPRPSTRKATP